MKERRRSIRLDAKTDEMLLALAQPVEGNISVAVRQAIRTAAALNTVITTGKMAR